MNNKLSKPKAIMMTVVIMKQASIMVKFLSMMTVIAERIIPTKIIVTLNVTRL